MRSVCDTAGRYLDMEILTGENIDVQDEYTGERDRLEKWLDEQFLIQSRMAACHCEDNLEKLTRDDLYDLADYMGIEYIYVLDKSGKTVVTNSPDVNFALSKDDNTAEFFPLLSGRNEVVQEPLTDERSGETKQYIGIGLRDKSVINRSGDFTRINMEIYVSGKTDIREVEELMAKKLPDMKNSVEGLVRAPKYAGISNITATEMRLKFSLYTISYKRSDARMGFIRQMKLLFEENGIEMPGSSGSSASDDLGF